MPCSSPHLKEGKDGCPGCRVLAPISERRNTPSCSLLSPQHQTQSKSSMKICWTDNPKSENKGPKAQGQPPLFWGGEGSAETDGQFLPPIRTAQLPSLGCSLKDTHPTASLPPASPPELGAASLTCSPHSCRAPFWITEKWVRFENVRISLAIPMATAVITPFHVPACSIASELTQTPGFIISPPGNKCPK